MVLKGAERGVSNRDDQARIKHETLPRNRFLLHGCRPPRLRLGYDNQWAVTPKLTMIAGQQLSIGDAFGVKAPFSIQQ